MTVIADTSPICYLLLLGRVEVLPQLFGVVTIPVSVLRELKADGAPEMVRAWTADLPPWVEVCDDPVVEEPAVRALDAGERAAIALAMRAPRHLLIIDEGRGRALAAALGLRVTGLLGVLKSAAGAGLLDLRAELARLKQTNFRMSESAMRTLFEK
jgi:predicted nucleic acid-binding protein